jgi:hypothetical protein
MTCCYPGSYVYKPRTGPVLCIGKTIHIQRGTMLEETLRKFSGNPQLDGRRRDRALYAGDSVDVSARAMCAASLHLVGSNVGAAQPAWSAQWTGRCSSVDRRYRTWLGRRNTIAPEEEVLKYFSKVCEKALKLCYIVTSMTEISQGGLSILSMREPKYSSGPSQRSLHAQCNLLRLRGEQ